MFRQRYSPSDWAVRHFADWPYNIADGIARNGVVPDSLPIALSDY